MAKVHCWCCDNFIMIEDPLILKYTTLYGICKQKCEPCYMHDKVCKFFTLRKGLHTERTIPDEL